MIGHGKNYLRLDWMHCWVRIWSSCWTRKETELGLKVGFDFGTLLYPIHWTIPKMTRIQIKVNYIQWVSFETARQNHHPICRQKTYIMNDLRKRHLYMYASPDLEICFSVASKAFVLFQEDTRINPNVFWQQSDSIHSYREIIVGTSPIQETSATVSVS